MLLGSLPCLLRFACLCLDLHAYAFYVMLVLRSTCLCLDLSLFGPVSCVCLDRCVYVFCAMFACLDLYVGCYAMCFYSPFVPWYLSFFSFGLQLWGVDLDPVV